MSFNFVEFKRSIDFKVATISGMMEMKVNLKMELSFRTSGFMLGNSVTASQDGWIGK